MGGQVGWLSSNYIASMQKFSVLTGEPNVWLFIYAGLANIDQSDTAGIFSGGEASNPTVNIVLDNISGELLGSAATASLANVIGGDQSSIQSVSLSLQDNGDLVLTTVLYVFAGGGDSEILGAYSYYASAKILLVPATIGGTIRWKKTLATPLAPPHFAITADTEVPPPPGQLLGTSIVEANGLEGGLESSDPIYYYVPYTITGGLLGKTVTVEAAPILSAFSGVQGDGYLTITQISGPTSITLTTSNLTVTNVDFEMDWQSNPK
jgi:hypothetical protein